MKKLVLAAALTGAASTAFAGGMAEPVPEMSVAVVEEQTSSSAAGIIVPLLLLVLILAASSN
ncbi:MAG: hypothetical protein LW715_00020 [Rhodobacter sp.]|jgi:hypothetical protein|nr:hypothetical protein [Rhodobacter sp.]MCE2747206.1 hypothetical protein [Rhodobacter sp.]